MQQQQPTSNHSQSTSGGNSGSGGGERRDEEDAMRASAAYWCVLATDAGLRADGIVLRDAASRRPSRGRRDGMYSAW